MIEKKDANSFPMALLVTATYLLLGFMYGWWHPYWALFLLIPLYHIIAAPFAKKYKTDDEKICECDKENKDNG